MSEEKAPYNIVEAKRAIAQAEAAETQACAAEVTAVLTRWRRNIVAVVQITQDGRVVAQPVYVVVPQE